MENQKKNQIPEAGETKEPDKTVPMCSCRQDPFADLPVELRPKVEKKNDYLRKVTCPGCGLVYWTNRETDLCIECGKKDNHSSDAKSDTDGW